jgi:hypothetical protein
MSGLNMPQCDRVTRADRGLTLLQKRRDCGKPVTESLWPVGLGWVPLPELQRELGAQHGARLKELRNEGHSIENVMLVRPSDGTRLSWYRLAPCGAPVQLPLITVSQSADSSLWGEPDSGLRGYRE